MYWKISSPSRLHFGLIDLTGDHGRIDGGTGVAINEPRIIVKSRKGTGQLDIPEDLNDLVKGLSDRLNIDLNSVDLELVQRFPSHVGLGSHTQIALAIGTALSRASSGTHTPRQIAQAAKRGGTSGIGVNVFSDGGLVIDGGHSFGPGQEKEQCLPSSASRADVAPMLARYDLPEQWRFVLITPRTELGAHGKREVDLFGEAFPLDPADTGEVCRRILLGLMPGAKQGNIELLGQSLSALQSIGFKRHEVSLQPKPVVDMMEIMLRSGATGAGLSSFGPTVYALTADESVGQKVLKAALSHLDQHNIEADGWVTQADNRGAIIEQQES